MPCAEIEALEARCQAWRDWGVASDKETDQGDNYIMEDAQEDLDDPPELSVVEARVHQEPSMMTR